jgi:hypothetical protein
VFAAFENLDDDLAVRVWVTVRGNINISGKESVVIEN